MDASDEDLINADKAGRREVDEAIIWRSMNQITAACRLCDADALGPFSSASFIGNLS